jgi:HPt (histidine-containing phosphotransfer) domain-containing protein
MNIEPRVCDLSGALSRMGGDRKLLRQIVEFFREDTPACLARLHAALDMGDPAGVEYMAHALHGLVANFGADAATLAAQRVQEIGHSGDLTLATEAVKTLEDEINRLESALVSEAGSEQERQASGRGPR